MTIADIDARRFVGYADAPIPDGRDAELSVSIDELVEGGPTAVAGAISAIGGPESDVLKAYGSRMASTAVRGHDRAMLVRGLVAVVVGGLHAGTRDALMVTSLIDDACDRIDAEPSALFGEVANIVGHPGSVHLMRWLSRPPEVRSIDQMGFVAGDRQDGFRYFEVW